MTDEVIHHSPTRIAAGQLIASGMRVPESYRFVFARGKGIPLSLVITTSVFWSSPAFSIALRIERTSLSKRWISISNRRCPRERQAHRVTTMGPQCLPGGSLP